LLVNWDWRLRTTKCVDSGCPARPFSCTRQDGCSLEDFAAHAVAELGLALSPDAFRRDFDSWLTGPVDGAFDIVARIPARYRVGVLSNMSARHWQTIVAMGLPRTFDFVCVSHETGLLKPSHLAFEDPIRKTALPPNDVLFLDDAVANIEAARRLGIAAVLVKTPDDIEAARAPRRVVTERLS
jgi:putative hydrolase of the HAD superfamily